MVSLYTRYRVAYIPHSVLFSAQLLRGIGARRVADNRHVLVLAQTSTKRIRTSLPGNTRLTTPLGHVLQENLGSTIRRKSTIKRSGRIVAPCSILSALTCLAISPLLDNVSLLEIWALRHCFRWNNWEYQTSLWWVTLPNFLKGNGLVSMFPNFLIQLETCNKRQLFTMSLASAIKVSRTSSFGTR